MPTTNPSPSDLLPRSHPEDRQEGNFNPDPNLVCWDCEPEAPASGDAGVHAPVAHGPSGEYGDDDGAGNPSPRTVETPYGQEDADQDDLGAT